MSEVDGYYTVYTEEPPFSGAALAGLLLAIAGVCTIVSAPIGAALGHFAKGRITSGHARGRGVANAAIIIGWTVTLGYGCCCGALVYAFPDQLHWLMANL